MAARRARGFTLIELLVTLAVLGIAVAIGMPSYQTWIASTQVRTAAESFLSGLQMAKGEAVARNVSVAFRQDDTAKAAWCVTLNSANCTTPLRQRSEKDGGSVVITVAYANGAAQTAVFDGFGRLTSPTPTDTTKPLEYNFTHPAVSDARALRITLDISGTARLCDPSISSSSDPRKCPS